MNPHKLVALRMMPLSRVDRLRLLRRLPRGERRTIRVHLNGLQRFEALDIPFRYLLARLLTGAEKARFLQQPLENREPLSKDDLAVTRLDHAGLDRLEPVLRQLPLPLQASLLRSHAWQWRREYLNRRDWKERQTLLTYLHQVRVMTGEARNALVRTLLDYLETDAGGTAGVPPEPGRA